MLFLQEQQKVRSPGFLLNYSFLQICSQLRFLPFHLLFSQGQILPRTKVAVELLYLRCQQVSTDQITMIPLSFVSPWSLIFLF
jgi:hypothetical protein